MRELALRESRLQLSAVTGWYINLTIIGEKFTMLSATSKRATWYTDLSDSWSAGLVDSILVISRLG